MSSPLVQPWFQDRAVVERTRHVARVLTRHGLGSLVERAGLRRFAPRWRRGIDRPLGRARRLRLACGELGVTFIKLGQMLSTRSDLVPADVIAELSQLQDAAPPVATETIVETLAAELGAPPDRVFASFDPVPLASASIGQVHGAVLHDGTQVVVKVRRPDVVEQVERDLEIVARLARWLRDRSGIGRELDWTPLVDEFAYTLRNELDYVREGRNADRFRQAFASDPTVWIPRVHWAFTTERVLTLDRVGGVKVGDDDALERLAIPRRAVAENAVRMFLREVLELGFFHADPHPGNFFVQPDGSLALVDFGMVGRVNEAVRSHLLRAGLAAMDQDADSLAEELFALGVAGPRANRTAFTRDLDHLIGGYQGRSVRDLSATAVTGEIGAIAFRHQLQLPGELALLLRVVSMSEGLGLKLDPDFRYLEFAGPIVRASWHGNQSVRSSLARLGRSANEAATLGLDFPRRTARLLGRVERGEIELNVRHEGLEQVTQEFQRMTNRLAVAMVLAASVVALGVALGAHGAAGIEGHLRTLFTLGFLFSLAFGVWLLASLWRAGRR